MTPKQRKDALKKQKVTQKAIAQKLGVSEMSVSKAIHELIVSDRIYAAVADGIGKPKEQVFNAYYHGPKLRRTSKAFGNTRRK
ncbi:MAG: HTH domain-containing protein [Thermodesulfobacteriota bacterium]